VPRRRHAQARQTRRRARNHRHREATFGPHQVSNRFSHALILSYLHSFRQPNMREVANCVPFPTVRPFTIPFQICPFLYIFLLSFTKHCPSGKGFGKIFAYDA
jgi:hypothetical protein